MWLLATSSETPPMTHFPTVYAPSPSTRGRFRHLPVPQHPYSLLPVGTPVRHRRPGPALALAALAVFFPVLPGPAWGQEPPGGTPSNAQAVVVIVRVPKPWYAPRALVTGKMRDSVPQYARVPDLLFKAFTFEQGSGDFGGVYFWRDKASASAWFSPTWYERVRSERGAEPQVRLLDAPVSVDNTPGGPPASMDSTAVVTLVEIPVPAGLSPERLATGFADAVPTYRKVPGLLRKHFTRSEQGKFGGVYVWKDEAAARAWFTPGWHDRVRQTYGQNASIEWFDAPVLLPSELPVTPLSR